MAEAIMLGQGGLVNSDNVSVTKDKVIENKTYMGSDTDDEIGVGTMPDHAAYTTSPDLQVTGSSLIAHVPFGAYRENAASGYPELTSPISVLAPTVGLTAAKIMVGQTAMSISGAATSDANVVANRMLSGYSAYAKGQKINGTLAPTSIYNFSVYQYVTNQIGATWVIPSSGPWSGVRIMAKQGSYPTGPTDGTLFYEGTGTYQIQTLAVGLWYFRAWNYITTNMGRIYGGYSQGTVQNNQISGSQIFTSSGTFTVPTAVRQISVFLVGGGAASGRNNGGGGGWTSTWLNVAVSPGQQFSVGIGAGGTNYGNGGNTTFGSLVASGGAGWAWGGGEGGQDYRDGNDSRGTGGKGGSDGAGGESWWGTDPVPNGQNHTTRAFGESTNTLYAGGGGGSIGLRTGRYNHGGAGGAGGGGNGDSDYNPYGSSGSATNGLANTGGGAGGVSLYNYNDDNDTRYRPSRNGGSGICIVRWG